MGGQSGSVETVEDAIKVLPQVLALDRCMIRATFDERFTVKRMAQDYVRLYRKLLNKPIEMRRVNGVGAGLAPQIQVSHEPNRT